MDIQTRAHDVPSHVPQDLVIDVDMYDIPGGREDAQGPWRDLKTKGHLSYSPRNGGHWITTTAESVFEVLRDAKHFSSIHVAIPKIEDKPPLIPIEVDPPNHATYRKMIMPLFTSDAVEAMGPGVRDLCAELIEEFRPSGQCEFIQDFAFKFPLGIFMQMMGLPAKDRMYLRELVERFVVSPDIADKMAAQGELVQYIDGQLDERQKNPTDDATTMVLNATFEGRPYSRTEMHGVILLLLFAGLDTVAGFLSFITFHLAQRPDQVAQIREKLDDTTAMHEVVQELLRRFAIANLGRVLLEDYEYRGVQMKRGDMVLIPTSIFNMDHDRVKNPDEVDFDREKQKHVTFGSGPHTCAGALLARKEILIFLEEWIRRIPDFRLHPDHSPRLQALPLNQVHELWLQWDG